MRSTLREGYRFRSLWIHWIGLLITAACPTFVWAEQPSAASQPYIWKSVQIVGGGFVDGIVFHPTEKGLRYARTDIGGAYRWDEQTGRWQPLLDWVPYKDTNLMGVESIAVDPSDANRLYLACGMYTNATSPDAAILRSDDCGATFQRADMPFKMGGNEDGRGNGERLAVDPNDGRVIYFGSRFAGLWRSEDRGETWSKVAGFPDVHEGPATRPAAQTVRRVRNFGFAPRSSGIVFEIFDPRSGSAGKRSEIIYAGVSLLNRPSIFRSTDAGQTWQAVPGQPTSLRPSHGAWASDGVIYFSYGSSPGPSRMTDGAIWKYDTNTNQWTDITPEKPDAKNGQTYGYGAVSVDASNPKVAIASTFYHPNGEEIFRTIDGGKTWKPIFRGGGVYDYSIAPFVQRTPIHWLLDIQIDPCDPNHAIFTTGYGGWETFDLANVDANKPTHWSVMSKGIEETVALQLISPPAGAHLLSAIGDYGGFVHWDLDSPSPEGSSEPPRFGNTTGIAFAAKNPGTIVRVGIIAGAARAGAVNLGYSLDGGKTWQPSKTAPTTDSRQGSICVNADGARWIWTPQRGVPWLTTDRGATWARCGNLLANMRAVADPIDPMKFYSLDLFGGKQFTSTDGGVTFKSQPLNLPDALPSPGDRGDDRGGQDQLYAAPDRTGDLWLPTLEGLYHSPDSGQTFLKIDGPTQIRAFGFGKPTPGSNYPALYLIGTIAGQPGIFRSDDAGAHWIRINDDQHQYGLLLQITGDPRIYGRVYVGTHGRGIIYGDPMK